MTRALAEEVFWAAVAACDPARRVREALADPEVAARMVTGDGVPRRRFGLAAGKAALAMARGAGEVAEGLVIVPADGDGDGVPAGWRVIESAHPLPDERSVAAARAARALLGQAGADDVVLALISGGTSALLEEPRDGISLDELRDTTSRVMASGAPIAELNRVRASLSAVKAGGLVRDCAAPVITLAVSDVIGDSIDVIGSAPTIHRGPSRGPVDVARVIAPMIGFARAAHAELARRGIAAELVEEPLEGEVADLAPRLAARQGAFVAWGEPTLHVPEEHGEGGRAQQLALSLAEHLRGQARVALVIGSDGVDGPPPHGRPAPAGAFVDGTTWDEIARAGLDPARALARCDAGPALAAAGALVITGPTGINHADLVILL